MNRIVTLVSFSIRYADSIPHHDVWFIGVLFHFSDIFDDDDHWFSPELCGKQQLEPAATSGTVWNQVAWWKRFCQPSIHLHHAQVTKRVTDDKPQSCSVVYAVALNSFNFLRLQSVGPPRFPTGGRQPAQIQLRR